MACVHGWDHENVSCALCLGEPMRDRHGEEIATQMIVPQKPHKYLGGLPTHPRLLEMGPTVDHQLDAWESDWRTRLEEAARYPLSSVFRRKGTKWSIFV